MLASITENIVFLAMPVQIQTEVDPVFLVQTRNLLLEVEDLRVEETGRLPPATIQIYSGHIAPKITVNHSVDVNHWVDFKDVFI